MRRLFLLLVIAGCSDIPDGLARFMPLGDFDLSTPSDGVEVSANPTFTWTAASRGQTYRVDISPDYDFGMLVGYQSTNLLSLTWSGTPLERGKMYFWRVVAEDEVNQYVARNAPRTFTVSP